MTDTEKIAIAFKTLQRIAADHERTPAGLRRRVSRDQAIFWAREACEAIGITYGAAP